MTRLEKITHILLIVVCVVSVALLLERRFDEKANAPIDSVQLEHSLVGTRFLGHQAVSQGTPNGVVLFVSDHCPYCAESIPFYQRLAKYQSANSSRFAPEMAGNESSKDLQAYLAKSNVPVMPTEELPRGANKLTMTPILLIVDRGNVIRKVFVGKLSEKREDEVLNEIGIHEASTVKPETP